MPRRESAADTGSLLRPEPPPRTSRPAARHEAQIQRQKSKAMWFYNAAAQTNLGETGKPLTIRTSTAHLKNAAVPFPLIHEG